MLVLPENLNPLPFLTWHTLASILRPITFTLLLGHDRHEVLETEREQTEVVDLAGESGGVADLGQGGGEEDQPDRQLGEDDGARMRQNTGEGGHRPRSTGRLAADHSTVVSYRRMLAVCSHNVGNELRRRGRYAEALPFYERGREERAHLVRADGKNLRYQYELAVMDQRIARVYESLGRPADARRATEARDKDIDKSTGGQQMRVSEEIGWLPDGCPWDAGALAAAHDFC